MDFFYSLILAAATILVSAILLAYFSFNTFIKLVFIPKRLLELFELLHWTLKTDYTPVEICRQQLIMAVKLLVSEFLGLDTVEVDSVPPLETYNDYDMSESDICDEPPKEDNILTYESSIGRRTSRRVGNARAAVFANAPPQPPPP
ncbi:unnamed protein product [Orchesella dallaii]|uniref:Uncharacterized protein n=1 Tax=Orchesella dallaii TaxID=48710 RepID=A0ABP1QF25_9HEXA